MPLVGAGIVFDEVVLQIGLHPVQEPGLQRQLIPDVGARQRDVVAKVLNDELIVEIFRRVDTEQMVFRFRNVDEKGAHDDRDSDGCGDRAGDAESDQGRGDEGRDGEQKQEQQQEPAEVSQRVAYRFAGVVAIGCAVFGGACVTVVVSTSEQHVMRVGLRAAIKREQVVAQLRVGGLQRCGYDHGRRGALAVEPVALDEVSDANEISLRHVPVAEHCSEEVACAAVRTRGLLFAVLDRNDEVRERLCDLLDQAGLRDREIDLNGAASVGHRGPRAGKGIEEAGCEDRTVGGRPVVAGRKTDEARLARYNRFQDLLLERVQVVGGDR